MKVARAILSRPLGSNACNSQIAFAQAYTHVCRKRKIELVKRTVDRQGKQRLAARQENNISIHCSGMCSVYRVYRYTAETANKLMKMSQAYPLAFGLELANMHLGCIHVY